MLSWTHFIPTWVWIALATLALGAGVKFIRVVGWQGALAAVLAVITLGALATARKQGWEERDAQGREDVKKVMVKARAARERAVADNADPDRLYDDDGFRRKD